MNSKRTFKITQLDFTIQLDAQMINRDLLIEITGGDVPHLGSIVMYDAKTVEVTVKNFQSHHGRVHKDGMLAEKLIDQIKEFLPGNCVVTAGIHINQISRAQIQKSFEMVHSLGEELIDWLQTTSFEYQNPMYYKNSTEIDKRGKDKCGN